MIQSTSIINDGKITGKTNYQTQQVCILDRDETPGLRALSK